jgi:uncharacterized protein YheU (UPF0270 family)
VTRDGTDYAEIKVPLKTNQVLNQLKWSLLNNGNPWLYLGIMQSFYA